MSFARKGLRRIVVQGVEYHWRATYTYVSGAAFGLADPNLEPFESVVSVFRREGAHHQGFSVRFGPRSPDAVVVGYAFGVLITPSLVRREIERALRHRSPTSLDSDDATSRRS